MNRNFGKLNDGKLAYAPDAVQTDEGFHINPTSQHYATAGWLAVHDEKPTDKVGVYFIPDGWEERNGEIYRVWREEPIVAPKPPVTRYSGWKMYKAIKAEGFGDAFDALMKDNIGVMIAFVRPQYFLSDDEDFTSMVAKLCTALGIDDEMKDRILTASVDEDIV